MTTETAKPVAISIHPVTSPALGYYVGGDVAVHNGEHCPGILAIFLPSHLLKAFLLDASIPCAQERGVGPAEVHMDLQEWGFWVRYLDDLQAA